MTRSRSTAQHAENENAILALSRKVGKGKGDEKLYAAEVLIRRLRKANERDRAGTSIPDGYPSGTGFEAFSNARFTVRADDFEGESSIELTSVELAIERRLFSQRSVKDHHHELTGQANDELANVVGALDRLYSLLARIDNLVDMNPNAANAIPGCRSHARLPNHKGEPTWASAAREAGGRNGLCRDCNDWAGAHNGELPPVEIVALFDRKGAGRLTTKDVAEAMKAAKRKAS